METSSGYESYTIRLCKPPIYWINLQLSNIFTEYLFFKTNHILALLQELATLSFILSEF